MERDDGRRQRPFVHCTGPGLAAACLLGLTLMSACGGSATPAAPNAPAAKPAGSSASAAPTATPALIGPLAQLYKKARAEGSVVFEGPPPAPEMQPMITGFEKAYPGVAVHYQNVTAEQILPALEIQEQSHNVQIDLAEASEEQVSPLLDHHIMTQVDWTQLGIPASEVFQQQWIHWYQSANVVAYNTQLLHGSGIPQSWNDLLKPAYAHGKIALDARGHFLLIYFIDPSLGQSQGVRLAEGLKAQDPLMEPRMNSGLSALEAGQVSLAVVTTDTMLVARRKGAPVDVTPVSPVYAGTFGLYAPQGAPHAAAAELLADYLTSPAGRALFERTSYHALVEPCSVSTTATYLCSHHVKPVTAGTVADMKAEPGWLVTVEKALGTYKGK